MAATDLIPRRLLPVGSIAQKILACDDVYFYAAANQVMNRIAVADIDAQEADWTAEPTVTSIYDFGAGTSVAAIWGHADHPGLVLAVVDISASSKQSVYLSKDSGATFTQELLLGDTDGTEANQIAGVEVLRSITLANFGGVPEIYLGEYNVNGSRVSGGANDQVRIMKRTVSDAAGATWSEVVKWNTNGTNYVKHIHAVRYDSNSGRLYVATGDGNPGVDHTQCWMFGWDGSAALEDNTFPQNMAAYGDGVWSLEDAQTFRGLDIEFDADWVYWTSDASATTGDGHRGIWKASKDLSWHTRIDDSINDRTDSNGFYAWDAMKWGDDFYFSDGAAGTADDFYINIVGYRAGGSPKTVGRCYLSTNSAANLVTNAFETYRAGARAWITCASPSGAKDTMTVCYRKGGPFINRIPEPIYPVAFIAPTGEAVAGNGYLPHEAYGGIDSGTEGTSKITYGTRVLVWPGTYSVNQWRPTWDSFNQGTPARTGQAGAPVMLSSATHDASDVTIQDMATQAAWIQPGHATWHLIVNVNLKMTGDNHSMFFGNATYADAVVEAIDCELSAEGTSGTRICRPNPLTFRSTRCRWKSGDTYALLYDSSAVGKYYGVANIYDGPVAYYRGGAGSAFVDQNSYAKGYSTYICEWAGTGPDDPVIKGMVGKGESATASIKYGVGNNDANTVDYCLFAEATAVPGEQGAHSVIDADLGDRFLNSDSEQGYSAESQVLRSVRADPSLPQYDFNGDPFRSDPAGGAIEYGADERQSATRAA